jgi:hypothetical protein
MKRVRLTRAKSSTNTMGGATVTTARLLPFGPPPLLEGEDTAAYDELLLRISTAVKPIDILDEICVRDYVDLTWEILRFRRLLIGLISASAYGALEKVLDPLFDAENDNLDEENADPDGESNDVDEGVDDPDGEVDELGWEIAELNEQRRKQQLQDLLKGWVRRKADAINEVNRILAKAGLTMDAVWAEVLSERIDDIERIERVIAMLEARRNAILRESDRRRTTLGQNLRQAVQQVEAENFAVIETKSAKRNRAA